MVKFSRIVIVVLLVGSALIPYAAYANVDPAVGVGWQSMPLAYGQGGGGGGGGGGSEGTSVQTGATGGTVTSGSGVVVTVPPGQTDANVSFGERSSAPQDSNGVFGLGPLVGVSITGKLTQPVEVWLPIPPGFGDRSIAVGMFVDGKYVIVQGYRQGDHMVVKTLVSGDFAIVEAGYFQ